MLQCGVAGSFEGGRGGWEVLQSTESSDHPEIGCKTTSVKVV